MNQNRLVIKSGQIIRAGQPKYTNSYFGLAIPLPGDWHLMESLELLFGFKKVVNSYLDLTEEQKATLESTDNNTLPLVRASQYPLFTQDIPDNPSITCTAFNMAPFPQIRNEADYLADLRESLQKQKIGATYRIAPNVENYLVNGIMYYSLAVQADTERFTINSRVHCVMRKGYILNITLTFRTDSGRESLNHIFNSIKLN